ncbi:RNA polymerase sigma factor [Ulvibacterium sp.]|uniref:RNA polymerase sigma factor n=1 Tax=Ulvibacterium sp. TaxID=2665914 RepID=UPI00262EC5C0|nr:RNA polymerase sigma factor [Ulvibacterium sp.]
MNPNKIFDALLVLQSQSGSKKALGLLVKRYHGKLCRHSYWYTHDLDAAKDIVQDSWSVIITKLPNIRDPNAFGSWAMRIVTRKSLDFLNRNKSDREKLRFYHKTQQDLDTAEDKESDLIQLEKAIKQLPNTQQVVLRLFYTEEYSLKEISAILEISTGTVKSRLFHAREKLKTILKK